MATRLIKSSVKAVFVTGAKPSQSDFSNFVDASVLPIMDVVVDSSAAVATDASLADIFRITLAESVVLSNPTNAVDGQACTYWIEQGGTGSNIVTLDTKFVIPASASPLVWSTTVGSLDMLSVRYDAGKDKFYVISFIPGYNI